MSPHICVRGLLKGFQCRYLQRFGLSIDNRGIPILEIIKERDALLICETNNLGRNIKIRSSAIPSLLLTLKALSEHSEHVACDVLVDRSVHNVD
jgi:hypothetical protein